MKRLVLRFTVAILAFGFGLVVHDGVLSRVQTPRTVGKIEPVAVQPVAACPSVAPVEAPTPKPYLLFDYNSAKFNPDGSYLPMSPLPKELKDFELFAVFSAGHHDRESGSALVQVLTNNESDFQNASFLLITEKRLFFFAAPRIDEQFEYRFNGEFLGNPGRLVDTGKPAVRGTLTKMRNGRRVAESVVTFEVQYLGC